MFLNSSVKVVPSFNTRYKKGVPFSVRMIYMYLGAKPARIEHCRVPSGGPAHDNFLFLFSIFYFYK